MFFFLQQKKIFFYFSLTTGYFTHPTLEKRIGNLIHEQTESINSDIKVISEEIFQR